MEKMEYDRDYDLKNDPELLEKELKEFYTRELKNEMEEYSEARREKEAKKRTSRAVWFYLRYKEYEESGFDKSKIQELFNLNDDTIEMMDGWLRRVFPHGLATTIFAEQGMGKTNTSSVFNEIALILRPEWDIITTVPYAFSPIINMLPGYKIDRIYEVGSMSGMLRMIAEIVLNKRVPAVLIDEFDSSYTATQTRSIMGISFKSFVYVERHFDCKGPALVYHRFKDIPTELRNKDISSDVFQVAWYHNSRNGTKKRVLSNPDLWDFGEEGKRYFPIPLTHLPYLNQGFGSFEMDIDMQKLNQHLNGTQEQAARKLIDLIQQMKESNRRN